MHKELSFVPRPDYHDIGLVVNGAAMAANAVAYSDWVDDAYWIKHMRIMGQSDQKYDVFYETKDTDGKASGLISVAADQAAKTIPLKQKETLTVVGTITTAGNAKVTVTAAGMTGSPKEITVAVAEADDASAIAGKVRTALLASSVITAFFAVSGATDAVILTAKTAADNDATMNISIEDGTCVGITTADSADTVAGSLTETFSAHAVDARPGCSVRFAIKNTGAGANTYGQLRVQLFR
jgi:hypothetical protein